jgi:hypothetical protein
VVCHTGYGSSSHVRTLAASGRGKGNLTEAEEIQSAVQALLTEGSIPELPFFTSTIPDLETVYDIETIDSPVRYLATDSSGRQTGIVLDGNEERIVEDIPGSQYFEFGGTKYAIIPATTPRTTRLFGTGHGGYTLTIVSHDSEKDSTAPKTQLLNATVTPTMVAEFAKTASGYSDVKTDQDGDGVFETVTDLNGQPKVTERSFSTLRILIRELTLSTKQKSPLLLMVGLLERQSIVIKNAVLRKKIENTLLDVLAQRINTFNKQRSLTEADVQPVLDEINTLKTQ